MWFKKIDKDLPIPFNEYTGHKSFVYYKKTKSGKNISLSLAWLKYNSAIQLLSQERILSFCLLENSKMKGLIRKGSKKDIILKESEDLRLDKVKLVEKNKIWSELAENLLCLEEEKWENLVKKGTKEQRLDFLRHKEKYSLLAVLDKYMQLRNLLKGCKLSTFKIYDRLRFSDENEITPADLINAVDEIRPILRGILKSINAALGESEE